MPKVLAITQARSSSTRLPAKVLKPIGSTTLLGLHITRILKSKRITKLIVATTTEPEDQKIVEASKQLNVDCYCGSLNDVLARFYFAAEVHAPDYVVRLTSDCPLIDASLIDQVIEHALENGVDYCSNTLVPGYPDGMDVEVFKFSALKKAFHEATLQSDREHVTPFIYRNSSSKGGNLFSALNFSSVHDYSAIRLTVDEEKDYAVITALVDALGTEATWLSYATYYLQHSEINSLNSTIARNEGYSKSLNNDTISKEKL